MKKEYVLMELEAERKQSEIRALDKIKSLRNHLDNLERKILEKEEMFDSDGLQGNGDYLDVYITKLATYGKVIKQVQNMD